MKAVFYDLYNNHNIQLDYYKLRAASLDVDYRIVEFARNLPLKYRLKGSLRKRILRDILSEYIPKEVFDQPKKGFSVPLADWIRARLKMNFLSILKRIGLNR